MLSCRILSGLFLTSKVKRSFSVDSRLPSDSLRRKFRVSGQVFFASSEGFVDGFDFREAPDKTVTNASGAQMWDISAVGTPDKAMLKFRREGAAVQIASMTPARR